MIYKIFIDNFGSYNNQIASISERYNTLLFGNDFYISDLNNNIEIEELIKYFNKENVAVINEATVKIDNSILSSWLRSEFTRADLIRYENDNQLKLQQAMKILDGVERELFEGSDDVCQKCKKNEEGHQRKSKTTLLMKIKNKLR